MNRFTPDNRQRQSLNRKAVKSREKRNIIIIVCVILAIVLAAAAVLVINHFKDESQSTFAPVDDVTVTETSAETDSATNATDDATNAVEAAETAETSEAAENSSDVTVEDYSATMYSTTETLNVRSEPSTNGSIIGQIGQDTPITVTGKCSNNWMRISYNGNTGYVSANYLSGTKDQSDAPYYIKVNRTQNIVIIYSKDENGAYTVPYKAMVCSVGLNGATPTGTYTTTDKYTWRLLSGNVYGQYATRITGHYLFHSVPYYTQSKSDLEYDEYNKLGEAASLGCIRLSVADAKWIYDNCPKGTTVTIYDSDEQEPLAKPSAIKIDTNDSRRGWDPTDPDSANPWNQ